MSSRMQRGRVTKDRPRRDPAKSALRSKRPRMSKVFQQASMGAFGKSTEGWGRIQVDSVRKSNLTKMAASRPGIDDSGEGENSHLSF